MNLSETEISLLESHGISYKVETLDVPIVSINLENEISRLKKINLLNSNSTEFISAESLLALMNRKLKSVISILNAYHSSRPISYVNCCDSSDELDLALLVIPNYETSSDIENLALDDNEILNELL